MLYSVSAVSADKYLNIFSALDSTSYGLSTKPQTIRRDFSPFLTVELFVKSFVVDIPKSRLYLIIFCSSMALICKEILQQI